MQEVNIHSQGESIEIEMNIKANLPVDDAYTSDVVTKAIVHLIEEMDTHLWDKDAKELQADEFYAAILTAVARHYAVDDPMERQQPAYQWLDELIKNLRENKHLHQVI